MRACLAAIAVLALVGCGGGEIDQASTNGGSTDPSNSNTCLTGDPDTGYIAGACGADLWDCSINPNKCKRPLPVPPGGGTWTCSWSSSSYLCTKPGAKDSPPGGAGWTCTWSDKDSTWSCSSKYPPNPSNSPAGGGSWACQAGKEFLTCDKTVTPPPVTPPPVTPPKPKPGDECVVGQKMWCDGNQYCGWGQVICDANGKWKRDSHGNLACSELADGRRPNTPCACYHTFFNEKCCETPDCLVPAGTSGQICPKSSGKLCDYCNAMNPECVGGKCVIGLNYQTYCGQDCSASKPCPTGYSCQVTKTSSTSSSQCIPLSKTCF